MDEGYLESLVLRSKNVGDFGIDSTDLLKPSLLQSAAKGCGLDFLCELVGDITLIHDNVPAISRGLRTSIRSNRCGFSLAALTALYEYRRCVGRLNISYMRRVRVYREATRKNSNLVILNINCESGVGTPSRSKPLRIYEIVGRADLMQCDCQEFLFGLGIVHSELMAESQSLLVAVRALMKVLLEVRTICLRAIFAINDLCPIWGEDKVREAVGYFKCQIEAVNKRDVSLQRLSYPKASHLTLVR